MAPFRNINARGDALPGIFQEMLTTAFIKDKHFTVVERDQLDQAIKELKISNSALVEPDSAKKLGKLLDADYMIVGGISDVRGKLSVDARIVNIESGESVSAADAGFDSGEGSGPSSEPIRHSAASVARLSNNPAVLGAPGFRTAWRESLEGDVWSFACGDTNGDGTARVAFVKGIQPPSAAGPILGQSWFEVAEWSGGQFDRVWKSDPVSGGPCYSRVNVPCVESGPAPILFSSIWHDCSTCFWQWNGQTYDCPGSMSRRCVFSGRCEGDPDLVTGFYDRQPFVARFAVGRPRCRQMG